MSDLTYFFGAGASCQAMPLVSNFKERYASFIEFLGDLGASAPVELNRDAKNFQKAIQSHFSFDTYFKKLFHQDNDYREIEKNKAILLLFFLFEHLVEPETLLDYHSARLLQDKKELNFDPRYEALIAGLLQPIRGESKFYNNVNFLTWNYDLNLLNALKNFIIPNEHFGEFMKECYQGEYFAVGPQVKVFHLNGFVNHPILNDLHNDDDIFKKFKKIIREYNRADLVSNSNTIKFSWENADGLAGPEIRECIDTSGTIILIGYSLPLYNRSIDSSILNVQNLNKKQLIIQNVNSKDIKDILDSDFDIKEGNNNISLKLIDNCNSFVVPRSIVQNTGPSVW